MMDLSTVESAPSWRSIFGFSHVNNVAMFSSSAKDAVSRCASFWAGFSKEGTLMMMEFQMVLAK